MSKKTVKTPTHEGEYGEHPIGGAVGAALGAAAGAAAVGAAQGAVLGTVAGLPGMAAGVAIGGVVGALAGKGIAQEINPTTEDAYWSENYLSRPYVTTGTSYDEYGPAYRQGVDAYSRNPGRAFEDVEPQLGSEWEKARGTSNLGWDNAKPAARDAYDRLYNQYKDKM
ncbi:MAG: hypothetical protein K2Q01_09615 [Rickettsiales bacterium]|nr:hypothetical protein [Rickettsiales bacterium]